MSNTKSKRNLHDAKSTFENFIVQADGHEPMSVLVNVNHDDPESFADREYRLALRAQGVPAGHIHRVRVLSFGTDGVQ